MKIAAIYVLSVSVICVLMTVYDKLASKSLKRHRVPERVLMLSGAAGGAAAMYITMLLIRHKTRHRKFMTGLPALAAVHAMLAVAAFLCFRSI
ncbi:MAG: DUF1294 domain-containing protein [Clostridiales bacterium]|jgi:uncharacterized membrane protein YsdA (DUF1294 family)|nr:DUF1294 domain-containing protein [Clostridiales bacterium]